jgi:threonine dehydrogenase-like Zn-dependent dehydrogenase
MFMRLEMMNSITCDSPGVLHATDREIPTPAHDEVLIRVARVGVCGTDFHIFQGKHRFSLTPSSWVTNWPALLSTLVLVPVSS